MADQQLLDLLKQGSSFWNSWRREPGQWIQLDLSGALLSEALLSEALLSEANLSGTNLSEANLSFVDLSGTNLSGANLREAIFIGTNLTNAILTNCSIFGISAWNVQLEGATQLSLTITPEDEPAITIDNLKVAQFIYLLLNNREIRDVNNTITSKVVLILGRFTPDERKAVLDALRDGLRKKNYLPIVFDFEQPGSRNLTETVSTLANMAHFVVADLTNAKSIPQELERIVPRLRVPVQPLLHTSEQKPYALFESFVDYPWVLPLYRYADQEMLLQTLREHVIIPAEEKASEYEKRRQEVAEEIDQPTARQLFHFFIISLDYRNDASNANAVSYALSRKHTTERQHPCCSTCIQSAHPPPMQRSA